MKKATFSKDQHRSTPRRLEANSVGKSKNWWDEFNQRRTDWLQKHKEEAAEFKDPTGEAPKEDVEQDPNDPRLRTLNQDRVDVVRYRAVLGLMYGAVQHHKAKKKVRVKIPVHHLWFPEDDIQKYELRAGNPPAESDRPKHLRGLTLVIDCGTLPMKVWHELCNYYNQRQRMHRQHKTSAQHVLRNRNLVDVYQHMPSWVGRR